MGVENAGAGPSAGGEVSGGSEGSSVNFGALFNEAQSGSQLLGPEQARVEADAAQSMMDSALGHAADAKKIETSLQDASSSFSAEEAAAAQTAMAEHLRREQSQRQLAADDASKDGNEYAAHKAQTAADAADKDFLLNRGRGLSPATAQPGSASPTPPLPAEGPAFDTFKNIDWKGSSAAAIAEAEANSAPKSPPAPDEEPLYDPFGDMYRKKP
jgi:hypothetical protein